MYTHTKEHKYNSPGDNYLTGNSGKRFGDPEGDKDKPVRTVLVPYPKSK